MKIFMRIIVTVLLLIFWFCVCGLLWGQIVPIEKIYWLAHCFGVFGDEDIYEFAALLSVFAASFFSVFITTLISIYSGKRG